jgi:hypothetical protein
VTYAITEEMHGFSLAADALPASFAKPLCCGGEIYRCSKGRLTDSARQLRLDACRTGSARRLCGVNGIDVDEG